MPAAGRRARRPARRPASRRRHLPGVPADRQHPAEPDQPRRVVLPVPAARGQRADCAVQVGALPGELGGQLGHRGRQRGERRQDALGIGEHPGEQGDPFGLAPLGAVAVAGGDRLELVDRQGRQQLGDGLAKAERGLGQVGDRLGDAQPAVVQAPYEAQPQQALQRRARWLAEEPFDQARFDAVTERLQDLEQLQHCGVGRVEGRAHRPRGAEPVGEIGERARRHRVRPAAQQLDQLGVAAPPQPLLEAPGWPTHVVKPRSKPPAG